MKIYAHSVHIYAFCFLEFCGHIFPEYKDAMPARCRKEHIPERRDENFFGKTPNPSTPTVMSGAFAMGSSAADFMRDNEPAKGQAASGKKDAAGTNFRRR